MVSLPTAGRRKPQRVALGLRRGFEAARDEPKLPSYLTSHDLRHAAASRLIASGIDDELIADHLGHEDSTITRRINSHVYDRQEKAEEIRRALS
jgi:integrase